MRLQLIVIRALVRRALNEISRVPGAAIPGVLAPTIFLLGLSSVFSKAASVPGYPTDSMMAFVIPVSLLQGAGFTGAATGVNLARDIEQGWFDRLYVCSAPRVALLIGIVASASLRCLLPAAMLLAVGFSFGVPWPGVDGLLIALTLMMGISAAVACYAVTLALKFRTQQAAPLMQMGSFIAVLFTTSYAPKELLQRWLEVVATVNPVTEVLRASRQGFVGDVTFADTWPGFVAVAGMLLVLGAFAVRGLRRYAD
jgi:ABC-type multidrug transport system permease subunit